MKNTYRGIVCEIGALPSCKVPLLAPTARRVLKTFERARGPAAVRDRALILLGLSGSYRVAELSSLRTEDVEFVDEGAVILLRRSKTDGKEKGSVRGSPTAATPRPAP